MMHRVKWIRLFAIVLGLAVVAAVVLYFALGRVIARAKIQGIVSDMGIVDASYDLRNFSLAGLEFNNVALGQPAWMTADSIRVSYSLRSLWNGRVKAIDVSGARWHAQVRDDGSLDLGFSPRSSGAAEPFDPMFDRVAVNDFRIAVQHEGKEHWATVNGDLIRNGARSLTADLKVDVADSIHIEPLGLALAGAGATVRGRVEFDADEVQFFAVQGSSIALNTMSVRDEAGRDFRIEPVQLTIEARGREPLARISFGGTDDDSSINANVHSTAAMSLVGGGIDASIPKLSLALSATRQADQPVELDALVSVDNAAFLHAPQQLRASGISASLPISINADAAPAAPPKGSFIVDSISFKGRTLPGLSGSAAMAGGRAQVNATWPVLDEAPVYIDGWLDFLGKGPRGEIVANTPNFELNDSGPITQFIPALQGASIGGTYALDGRIRLEQGRVEPLIKVTGNNVRIENEAWPLTIDSASGAITINSFDPLAMPARQRVHISQAHVGELEIVNGEVEFTLQRPDSLQVHELAWSMSEKGEFSAEPFQFNPASPRFQTTIHGQDVGLAEWLPLLTGGRATAEGSLSGHLTVGFDAATNQKIFFNTGELRSMSGGFIQTGDAEALSQLLDRDPRFQTDVQLRQVKEGIIHALKDFAFTSLRVEFTPEGRQVPFQVHLAGKGRHGEHPQELDLTLNFNDFNQVMNAAVFGKTLFQGVE